MAPRQVPRGRKGKKATSPASKSSSKKPVGRPRKQPAKTTTDKSDSESEKEWSKDKAYIVFHDTKQAMSFQDIDEAEYFYKKQLVTARRRSDVRTYSTAKEFENANLIILDSSDDEESSGKKPPAVTPDRPVARPMPPFAVARTTPVINRYAKKTSAKPEPACLQNPALRALHQKVQVQISGSGALLKVHYWYNAPSTARGSIVFIEFLDVKSQLNPLAPQS